MNGIEKAIALYGNASRVAVALGVTPQAVFFWRHGQRVFPAELCIVLERESRGAIACEELRPDVDWAYLRGTGVTAELTNTQPATPAPAGSDIATAAAGQGA